MKIRTSLSYFLNRKKMTLASYCERMGANTHEKLCMILDDAGVEHPERSETAFLLSKRKAREVSPSKPEQKELQSRQPRKQKSPAGKRKKATYSKE